MDNKESIILEQYLSAAMKEHSASEQHVVLSSRTGNSIQLAFRDLVEWLNEGVYCLNNEGALVFANERFCELTGYALEELLGTQLISIAYDKENRNLAKAKLELRKSGVADTYELKIRRKDGNALWLKVSAKPIIGSNGELMGVVAISADITMHLDIEEELHLAKEDLEAKIKARTRQLTEANEMLNEEIKERKVAEEAAKKSEQRFRDIYLNSPDAIYVQDYEGVILDVNEAACRLHEAKREDLIGKTLFDISPENIYGDIKKRQQKIMSGELTKFESECKTMSGKVIPIEVSVAHVEFQDLHALLRHVRDISDRKKHQELIQKMNVDLEAKVEHRTQQLAQTNERLMQEILEKEKIQKELQRQKDFLRLIIDSNPNFIFVKDKEGKYLLANESIARFYNRTPKEMEGQYDSADIFSEEQLNEFHEQDKQVLEKGEEVRFAEKSYVDPLTGKTVWLQTLKKPILSITGDEMNVLGISTDITNIKKAKEDLHISEHLYREIARNLPNAAMFIFDKNLEYILAEGPLVGKISRPKEEIEGRTVYDAIKDSERERVKNIYRAILHGESSEGEQSYMGRNLRVYHLPMRDDKGEIIAGMVMLFDISDLKNIQLELEERATQLQRSNEELERFAYVASHDLQGPLRTIASYLQLLEMRYKNKLDKEATEFIDFSVNGAKRMQRIILDLLNYSRIISMHKPFVMTDMDNEVKEVLRGLESTIKASRAKITVGKLPQLVAEPSKIYQVFLNLVDNAIKFVKDKTPEVKIEAIEHDNEWEFTVSDNGIGIKDEFKEKIFQIFQRLHTVNEYSGTGVGLAICQKIVQLHGGTIWFTSTPGEGTTFHFTISKGLAEAK